ncbi:MAG: purine-nucleoside phosphorylase [Chloroflexi bacterium]|nr:purine-nucleoside phosphorylase [Chloroflexota bacterium]
MKLDSLPTTYRRADYEKAAATIRRDSRHTPRIGIITGSGLGPLADVVQDADVIPYRQIPGFPISTVEGHAGQLVLGTLGRQPVAIMQGRVHYYEGYSMAQVAFPVRTLQALGIESLLVTNAAGGINESFRPGDLMLITDHINFVGMAGANPLRGPNDPQLGPRFPNMSLAYDPVLRARAQRAAKGLGFTLQEGVYIMLAGPSFETPADLRFLRTIGADAVGMSTVPEVIVARHGGTRVLGISLISNLVSFHPVHTTGTGDAEALHHEVLATGAAAVPRMVQLITHLLESWDEA